MALESAGSSRGCKSKARREKALTVILLSEEAPDLLSPLLRGVLIIRQVLHVLGIDHFENRLHQSKRNDSSEGAVGAGSLGFSAGPPARALLNQSSWGQRQL